MKIFVGFLFFIGLLGSVAWAGGLDAWTAYTGGGTAIAGGDDFLMTRYEDEWVMATSNDGVQWSVSNFAWNNDTWVTGLAFGNDVVVAVGSTKSMGALISTYSGGSWVVTQTADSDPHAYGWYRQVAYGSGTFVAVGSSDPQSVIDPNNTLVSGDGWSWGVRLEGGFNDYLSGVTFGNGMFVAVGPSGHVYSSKDGTNWTSAVSGTTTNLDCVAGGGGKFIAVGDGVEITSTDGLNWEPAAAVNLKALFRLVYGAGYFVGITSDGQLQYTSDGIHWANCGVLAGPSSGFDIAFFKGRFYAVGSSILRSGSVATFQLSIQPTGDSSACQVNVVGTPGVPARVQFSADMKHWQDWNTFTSKTGSTNFYDEVSSSEKFYRVVSP